MADSLEILICLIRSSHVHRSLHVAILASRVVRESSVAIILITGSSSGFGHATALAFARAGDTVYASMRNVDRECQVMVKGADL